MPALNARQAARLASVETQLELGFTEGYTGAHPVAKMDRYDQPMLVGVEDRTAEFKPKIKSPFKSTLAAMMLSRPAWQPWPQLGLWDEIETVEYYIDLDGRLHLRGIMAPGKASQTDVMLSVPAALRPDKDHVQLTVCGDSPQSTRVISEADTGIFRQWTNNNIDWVRFDGVSWRVA